MAWTVNVLLSTFAGLSLPPTLCVPLSSDTSSADAASHILSRLPRSIDTSSLRLITNTNKIFPSSTSEPLLSHLTTQNATPTTTTSTILPLTLTHLTFGGKGGFGSQLRAAGGRMSTKKRRRQGDPNASSRNLDGRRLRTVGEAKALAEYLAVKPDMDKKEKEERRRRWEDVVEASERTKEAIKEGKRGQKIDGRWIEEKEDVEARVREEIRSAMAGGLLVGGIGAEGEEMGRRGSSEESVEGSEGSESSGPGVDGEDTEMTTSANAKRKGRQQTSRKIYGWDEDDDEDEDEDEDEDDDDDDDGDKDMVGSSKGR